MEPVSSIVSTIFKLLQEIAKAARTARRNQTRCRELAQRADAIGNVLCDSMAGARGDAASTRKNMLCRLKEALEDALKLVESCRRRGGVVSRAYAVLTSGSTAARFEAVDKRITTCLVDLGAANGVSIESKIDQLAARDHPRANKTKTAAARPRRRSFLPERALLRLCSPLPLHLGGSHSHLLLRDVIHGLLKGESHACTLLRLRHTSRARSRSITSGSSQQLGKKYWWRPEPSTRSCTTASGHGLEARPQSGQDPA